MGNTFSQIWSTDAEGTEALAPLTDPGPSAQLDQAVLVREATGEQVLSSNVTQALGPQGHGASIVNVSGGTVNAAAGNVYITNIHNVGLPPSLSSIPKVRSKLSDRNFPLVQVETFYRRTEGTGQWLLDLDLFQQWIKTRGKVLWATGMPGAGKTHLAACVIDFLETLARQHTNVSVAFAYFRFSDPMSVIMVLEALVRQQAEVSAEAADLVAAKLDLLEEQGRSPSVSDYVDLLKDMSKKCGAAFFVLDGLDESPPDTQFDLLKVLATVNANVFIFSRPLKGMQSVLKKLIADVDFIDIAAQNEDIELLVLEKLERSPDFCELLAASDFKIPDLSGRVKQGARGMFLHAALQIEALRHSVSVADMMLKFEEFPPDLHGMYALTFDRIMKQPGEKAELAKRVLLWVVHSETGSISLQDLQRALATCSESETFDERRISPENIIISVCCGLVLVEPLGDIRLMHFTMKDALQVLLQSTFPHPHGTIAMACMAYLKATGYTRSPCIPEAWSIKPGDDARPKDLFGYAHRSLPFHIGNAVHEPKFDPKPYLNFIRDCTSLPVFAEGAATTISRQEYIYLSPIHSATWIGSPRLLSEIIKERPLGINMESPQPMSQFYDITPLMVGALWRRSEAIKVLLEAPNIDVNCSNIFGMAPLHTAILIDDTEIARLFLDDPRIDVNAADSDQRTPLMLAAKLGNLKLIKRILDNQGLEVNARDKEGCTALSRARTPQGLQLLLDHPAVDVNTVDEQGRTALMHMVSIGPPGASRRDILLSDKRVDVNAVDVDGMSALMLAVEKERKADKAWMGGVDRLLKVDGIDVNISSRDGRTAISIAIQSSKLPLIDALMSCSSTRVDALSAGLRDLLQNPNQTLPVAAMACLDQVSLNRTVSFTCQQGQLHLLRQLTEWAYHAGMEVIVGSLGTISFIEAAARGDQATVTRMIQDLDLFKVQINANHQLMPYGDSESALVSATRNRHLNVVKILLDAPGIDVNARTKFSHNTPLHVAIQEKNHEVVDCLLQHPDININIRDAYGRAAVQEAVVYGNEELAQRLRERPDFINFDESTDVQ